MSIADFSIVLLSNNNIKKTIENGLVNLLKKR